MTIKEKLELAKSRLILYLKAEQAILAGQSYEAKGLKLTRANLKDVQTMITNLENKISVLTAKLKGRKNYRVVRPGW